MAHLYLGLTLARQGERQRGMTEIESGMKGLYDWFPSAVAVVSRLR
jgi:hypothetical protein